MSKARVVTVAVAQGGEERWWRTGAATTEWRTDEVMVATVGDGREERVCCRRGKRRRESAGGLRLGFLI